MSGIKPEDLPLPDSDSESERCSLSSFNTADLGFVDKLGSISPDLALDGSFMLPEPLVPAHVSIDEINCLAGSFHEDLFDHDRNAARNAEVIQHLTHRRKPHFCDNDDDDASVDSIDGPHGHHQQTYNAKSDGHLVRFANLVRSGWKFVAVVLIAVILQYHGLFIPSVGSGVKAVASSIPDDIFKQICIWASPLPIVGDLCVSSNAPGFGDADGGGDFGQPLSNNFAHPLKYLNLEALSGILLQHEEYLQAPIIEADDGQDVFGVKFQVEELICHVSETRKKMALLDPVPYDQFNFILSIVRTNLLELERDVHKSPARKVPDEETRPPSWSNLHTRMWKKVRPKRNVLLLSRADRLLANLKEFESARTKFLIHGDRGVVDAFFQAACSHTMCHGASLAEVSMFHPLPEESRKKISESAAQLKGMCSAATAAKSRHDDLLKYADKANSWRMQEIISSAKVIKSILSEKAGGPMITKKEGQLHDMQIERLANRAVGEIDKFYT